MKENKCPYAETLKRMVDAHFNCLDCPAPEECYHPEIKEKFERGPTDDKNTEEAQKRRH